MPDRPDPRPLPEWFESWDEETLYIMRDAAPDAETATALMRRISIEDIGLTEDDIEGQEAVATSVPLHDGEEDTHRDVDGKPCPECRVVDVWEFAP